MKKRFFLFLVLSLPVAAGLVIWMMRPEAKVKSDGMNLLVITIDTLRADRLGCYGDGLARTPVIDRLAEEAILFQKCYTPVPLTLPAHCSLFTGLWPVTHLVRNNAYYRLGSGERTLAEALKSKGYRTSALVAAYVLKSRFGLDQGFDLYDDRLGSGEKLNDFDAEVPADRVYQKFQDWLSPMPQEPFFLWVHFYDPHKPYAPPPDYLKSAGGDPYRGEVSYVDHYVGRMVMDLKERNLLEKTLVVITGDHGEAFGEHGESGHGVFCYEESIRVPLIFYQSNLFRKPLRVRQRVRLVDVMPTLMEILGGYESENAQGQSFVGLMNGREEEQPRPVYLESLYGKEENNWAPLTGLISSSLKYLSLPQAELYDLEADPLERDNLFLKNDLRASDIDRDLASFIRRNGPSREKEELEVLSADEREKLESLGYLSSFGTSAQAGIDPKTGIQYQNRIMDLVTALDRGEVDRVESEAIKLIEETRLLKFPYAYSLLNLVYDKKKEWDKLQANLLRAIEIFGSNPAQAEPFRGNLLELHFVSRRFPEAEKVARDILHFNPAQAGALDKLGQICEARQDWSGALQYYLQARQIEPRNASLSQRAIKMFLKVGDHGSALREIESLLTQEDSLRNPDLLFTAAMLNIEAGNGPRAEDLLRGTIELAPSAQGFFHYALVLGKNGKVGQAGEWMEKAIAFTPNDLDEEQRTAARKALQVWTRDQP